MASRKGFPVCLSFLHWIQVRQVYCWLKDKNITTVEMDKAVEKIPDVELDDDEAKSENRYLLGKRFGQRCRTIRFRADEIDGAMDLLRSAAVFSSGQMANTIWTRYRKLKDVPNMDILADAGR